MDFKKLDKTSMTHLTGRINKAFEAKEKCLTYHAYLD